MKINIQKTLILFSFLIILIAFFSYCFNSLSNIIYSSFFENKGLVNVTTEKDSSDIFLNFVEEKSAPINFLEEIYPQIESDPNRETASVIETVVGGGTKVDNFFVKDTSNSSENLADYVNKNLPFSYNNTDEPLVLIYHTHTTEAYMTSFTGYYYKDANTRDYTTNVTLAGEVLKETLESAGIKTIHDTTVHDENYNGSYGRSLETVSKILQEYPSIKITIDMHRDSMTADDGTKYKPTVSINGQKSAQIMLIAGCDPTGELEYKNWKDNLILNTKIQHNAQEMYEGLMRPLMYCQRVYNMDATNASLLVEVGTEVNTVQEAKYAASLLGDVLVTTLSEVM